MARILRGTSHAGRENSGRMGQNNEVNRGCRVALDRRADLVVIASGDADTRFTSILMCFKTGGFHTRFFLAKINHS